MREILARLFSSPAVAVEMMVATLFANALVLATPIFVMHVLNRYVAFGVDTTLVTLAAGAVIAIAFEFGFRRVRTRLAEQAIQPLDEKAAQVGYDALSRTPLSLFQMFSANARRQAVSGPDTIRQAYNASNVLVFLDIPFALLFLGVLYLLSPVLSGIAAVFALIAFLGGASTYFSVRSSTSKRQAAAAERGQLAGAVLKSGETARLFDAAGILGNRWQSLNGVLDDSDASIARRQDTIQIATQSLLALMSVSLISVGSYLAVKGHLDIGALIGANILAARALTPIARFGSMAKSLAAAADAKRTLNELARVKKVRSDGASMNGYKGAIAFEDLGFTYRQVRSPLIEGLKLNVESGQTLAVTGPNGAGKSTLARLITGLLEPTRGRVLASGVDVQQLEPAWWIRQFSYLPQEPQFLPATIAENLLAANPDLDAAELSHLIELAGLRSFIDESPDGMSRKLDDAGGELALGIRRRLALARALAVGGPIMLVDEPTDGLDEEGRAIVYAAMNRHASAGGTIVACSHDPFILKGADWVIDLGRKPQPRVSQVPRTATGREVGE